MAPAPPPGAQPALSAFVRGTAEPGGDVAQSWAAYRTDVRSYRYRGVSVRGVFASYGSCSLTDPVADLEELGLL